MNIELLWEIPLSGLSFVFSRILRFVMQKLGKYYTASKQQKTPEWELVSAKFLEKPVKLLWAMTRARWNLHAMVAIVGPLEVNESISLDINSAQKSAKSWTAVVYTTEDFETITSISSLSISGVNQWETLMLKSGNYLVGLRYYHWLETVEFPTVKVDEVKVVESKTIPAPRDINSFYRDLIKRKKFLHVWLNYYVFNLLRYRKWLPQSFVQKAFLPVPNPETKFYYGAVKPGESVHFDLHSSLLKTYDVYYSLYSRECFPVDWYPITQPEHTTAISQGKCIYLVRIHPKFSREEEFLNDWVKIGVVSG
ncbi:MAG TPA: hypothetical protein DCL61_01950 [Cyanobacteria bacterium UBA12227]|nr:hypothetical protein [Cyanobacteria bacterium UBA12227]